MRGLYSVRLDSGYLPNLEELVAQDFFQRVEIFEGAGRKLKQTREDYCITGRAISLLANSKNSCGLKHISIASGNSSDESLIQGMHGLCNSEIFELKSLKIGDLGVVNNRRQEIFILSNIARIIAHSERMRGLESLEFSGQINSAALPILASSPNLGNLKKFAAGFRMEDDQTIASRWLAEFLSSPNGRNLEELKVGYMSEVTDGFITAACGLKNLKVLDLRNIGTTISVPQIKRIFESEAGKNLVEITLPHIFGSAALVGNIPRPNLEIIKNVLDLDVLTRAENLPGLRTIDYYFGKSRVSEPTNGNTLRDCRLPLAASPYFPSLMRILADDRTVLNIDTFRRVNAEAIEKYRAETQGHGPR